MIKKTNKELKIVEDNEKEIFTITNNKSDKIKVYDKNMVENLFDNRFNDHYKNLFMMTNSIVDSDDTTDSDTEIALIRLSDFKETILNRYAKYVSKDKLSKYLKKVMILENKINMIKTKSKSR